MYVWLLSLFWCLEFFLSPWFLQNFCTPGLNCFRIVVPFYIDNEPSSFVKSVQGFFLFSGLTTGNLWRTLLSGLCQSVFLLLMTNLRLTSGQNLSVCIHSFTCDVVQSMERKLWFGAPIDASTWRKVGRFIVPDWQHRVTHTYSPPDHVHVYPKGAIISP